MLRHWFQCPLDPFKKPINNGAPESLPCFFFVQAKKATEALKDMRFVRCFCCESSNLSWGLVEARWSDNQDFWSSSYQAFLLQFNVTSHPIIRPPPQQKHAVCRRSSRISTCTTQHQSTRLPVVKRRQERDTMKHSLPTWPEEFGYNLDYIWMVFGTAWYFYVFLKMLNFKIGHAIA